MILRYDPIENVAENVKNVIFLGRLDLASFFPMIAPMLVVAKKVVIGY